MYKRQIEIYLKTPAQRGQRTREERGYPLKLRMEYDPVLALSLIHICPPVLFGDFPRNRGEFFLHVGLLVRMPKIAVYPMAIRCV